MLYIFENMAILVDYKGIFEQLFRENYIRLCYHACSFLNDDEAAKDVVNDVFEKVWINFEKIERSQPVLPLLYTLVRNRCVSLLRHKKVKERFDQEWRLKEEAIGTYDRAIASICRESARSNKGRIQDVFS